MSTPDLPPTQHQDGERVRQTWVETCAPTVRRLKVAGTFRMAVVFDKDASLAAASLIGSMAEKLDRAIDYLEKMDAEHAARTTESAPYEPAIIFPSPFRQRVFLWITDWLLIMLGGKYRG